MSISKITVGRLYNLGNYEHIRYEITVDVKELEASTAIVAIEKILAGLAPIRNTVKSEMELKHMRATIEKMKTMPACEFERNYRGYEGTPTEIVARHEVALSEETSKRNEATKRAAIARNLFNDLGGAAQWKDRKLDWQDYDGEDEQ